MNTPISNDQLCASAVSDIRLILKPDRAWVTLPGSPGYYDSPPDPTTLQFGTFLSDENGEVVQSGVTYASSNALVMSINASTGLATAVSAGLVTIAATKDGRTAFAMVRVLGIDQGFPDLQVRTAYVLDRSKSMVYQSAFDGFPDRLSAAKQIAASTVMQLDAAKDQAGVIAFSEGAYVVQPLTTEIGDSLTDDTLVQGILNVGTDMRMTNLGPAFELALEMLREATDVRVIVILSDGENRPLPGSDDLATLLNDAEYFKSQGGVIICVGMRAHGDGYLLLRNLASGGYFLNVQTAASVQVAIGILAGIQGYYGGGVRPMLNGFTPRVNPIGGQLPDPSPLAETELSVPT